MDNLLAHSGCSIEFWLHGQNVRSLKREIQLTSLTVAEDEPMRASSAFDNQRRQPDYDRHCCSQI